jgi:hypothetical protein
VVDVLGWEGIATGVLGWTPEAFWGCRSLGTLRRAYAARLRHESVRDARRAVLRRTLTYDAVGHAFAGKRLPRLTADDLLRPASRTDSGLTPGGGVAAMEAFFSD